MKKTLCDDGIYPAGMEAPTYNFEKMNFVSRYFMLNFADALVFICLISMIIPFVSILKIILPLNNFLTKADTMLRGRFIVVLVNIVYFKMATVTVLNFFEFNPESRTSAFSSFSSIIMMIFVVLVPCYYLWQILIFYRELKGIEKIRKKEAYGIEED